MSPAYQSPFIIRAHFTARLMAYWARNYRMHEEKCETYFMLRKNWIPELLFSLDWHAADIFLVRNVARLLNVVNPTPEKSPSNSRWMWAAMQLCTEDEQLMVYALLPHYLNIPLDVAIFLETGELP